MKRQLQLIVPVLSLALAGGWSPAQEPDKTTLLRIGVSNTLSVKGKEAAAREMFQSFIKLETGADNEITSCKDWLEMTAKLADHQLQFGVFHGHEFALALEKDSNLEPLAIAVNGHIYRYIHVIVRGDSKIADFAGLRDRSLALPAGSDCHAGLYVERLCRVERSEFDTFFAQVTTPKSAEEALDDLVDGKGDATVVDRTGWEAYQRRKPGQAGRLQELVKSEALLPPVVCYHRSGLEKAKVAQFREGLMAAHKQKRGQLQLNLLKLTRFDAPPADFSDVLAQAQKANRPQKKPE